MVAPLTALTAFKIPRWQRRAGSIPASAPLRNLKNSLIIKQMQRFNASVFRCLPRCFLSAVFLSCRYPVEADDYFLLLAANRCEQRPTYPRRLVLAVSELVPVPAPAAGSGHKKSRNSGTVSGLERPVSRN